MNLNRYRTELIVGVSFVLMLAALFYKNNQLSSQAEQLSSMKKEIKDFKEILAYKRVWGDKGLSKKVDKLKTIVPSSKVNWSKKGKKLTVRYKALTPKELNRIMTKLMSLAVQIIEIDIVRSDNSYNMECKCKW